MLSGKMGNEVRRGTGNWKLNLQNGQGSEIFEKGAVTKLEAEPAPKTMWSRTLLKAADCPPPDACRTVRNCRASVHLGCFIA